MDRYTSTDLNQIVLEKFPNTPPTKADITDTFREMYRAERQRVFMAKSLPALDIIVAQIISVYKHADSVAYRDNRITELFRQYYYTADDIKNGFVIRFPAMDIASIQKLRYGDSTERLLAHNVWLNPTDTKSREEQMIADFKAIYTYNRITQFGQYRVAILDKIVATIIRDFRENPNNLQRQEELFHHYNRSGDSQVNADIYVDVRLQTRDLGDEEYFAETRTSLAPVEPTEPKRKSCIIT